MVIAGMGELHLDIYVERIRREYNVAVEVGAPKVSYRESPTQPVLQLQTQKQTGGSGQYAHIVGRIEPLENEMESDLVFEENVVGGGSPSSTFRRSSADSATAWPKGRWLSSPSWA